MQLVRIVTLMLSMLIAATLVCPSPGHAQQPAEPESNVIQTESDVDEKFEIEERIALWSGGAGGCIVGGLVGGAVGARVAIAIVRSDEEFGDFIPGLVGGGLGVFLSCPLGAAGGTALLGRMYDGQGSYGAALLGSGAGLLAGGLTTVALFVASDYLLYADSTALQILGYGAVGVGVISPFVFAGLGSLWAYERSHRRAIQDLNLGLAPTDGGGVVTLGFRF